jgi:hypothetical protein
MNRPLPATPEDATLVSALVASFSSLSAAGRALGIPQPRLSAARTAGKGRRLSAPQRETIREVLR